MSNEPGDDLLHQLGRHARERRRADLEREERSDHDPAARAASRPLDAEAQARIVEHLRSVIPDPRQPVRRRRPLGASRRRRWLALPLAAALTVALSALIYRSIFEPPSAVVPHLPPQYTLRIEGTVKQQRSAGQQDQTARADQGVRVVRLAPGNRLQVVLTPDRAASTAVAARAFLAVGKSRWQAVDPARLAVSDSGAVRLDAIIGPELPAATGVSQLLLVLGTPTTLPAAETAARASRETGTGAGDAWRAYRITLDVGEPP